MAMSAEHMSSLQFFSCNGDVSKLVKNSRVGRKLQTNKQYQDRQSKHMDQTTAELKQKSTKTQRPE